MSIPVQAAASMFAPQPVRATQPPSFLNRRRSSTLDKDTYFASFQQPSATPSTIASFFQGWSDKKQTDTPVQQDARRGSSLSNASVGSTDSASSYSSALSSTGMVHPTQPIIDRPHHPSPAHQRRLSVVTPQRGDGDDQDDDDDESLRVRACQRPRGDSVEIGNHINELLKSKDVQCAVDVLKDAMHTMSITDLQGGHDSQQVVATYSTMLRTLCEPKMARIINGISGIDLSKHPDAVYGTIIWRMFTKVVEAGYVLETPAYVAVVQYLVDAQQAMLALQAIYAMPRPQWDAQVYRMAISLHLQQTPKQIKQAENIFGEFGKPYVEVANPLAPTMLPPLRIETPAMARVSEQERFKMWMHYQHALSGTAWAQAREQYERENVDGSAAVARSRRRNSLLQDWAERQVYGATQHERALQDKIDKDNAMMYTAVRCQQYEYAWDLYRKMGAHVDEFTPRVAMHVCWRAFGATPIMTHVSRRSEWEARAWAVYTRFMCTEHMLPEQPEMPGFLHEMLLTAAFAPATPVAHGRYDKAFAVYDLLVRLQFHHLLRDDQIIAPMLCTTLLECRGAPAAIVGACDKAFDVWRRKRALDRGADVQAITSYAIPWALLVLCYKSGSVKAFSELLEPLLPLPGADLPTSLLAPVQAMHDTHLSACSTGSQCYFHEYIFRPVQFTDSQAPADEGTDAACLLDTFGFVCGDGCGGDGRSVQRAKGAPSSGPIAFVDHALHRRTNIADPNASMLAMAAAIGAGQDEALHTHSLHCTPNKAKSLIRHCFDVAAKYK